MSDGVQFGYSLGGNNNGNPLVTADCTTFSTQATAALASANLSLARYRLAAMSDGVRFGYSLGGYYSGNYQVTADCTTFSTQATAALASANLSLARYGLAAMSDYNV
jgi:phosphoenolpyruvate carboxylase